MITKIGVYLYIHNIKYCNGFGAGPGKLGKRRKGGVFIFIFFKNDWLCQVSFLKKKNRVFNLLLPCNYSYL